MPFCQGAPALLDVVRVMRFKSGHQKAIEILFTCNAELSIDNFMRPILVARFTRATQHKQANRLHG